MPPYLRPAPYGGLLSICTYRSPLARPSCIIRERENPGSNSAKSLAKIERDSITWLSFDPRGKEPCLKCFPATSLWPIELTHWTRYPGPHFARIMQLPFMQQTFLEFLRYIEKKSASVSQSSTVHYGPSSLSDLPAGTRLLVQPSTL